MRTPECCWCCHWPTSSTWGRAGYSTGVQWLAGALLLVGVLAQSGGFFVHLGLGQQGRSSPGTVLTRAGALLIAAALIILAVGICWMFQRIGRRWKIARPVILVVAGWPGAPR